ncbi:cytochrome c oxidase assembly protein [Bacillus xiapuensis]|uniref:cytochrome c oxidase assembly protein n=1 Tax=Bacillus xiapuensis TaxID=2014075 RepID=UPI000C24554A|nr:cytochrome c oxidase assembly protein [Bacillus xiapuensis]
MSGHVMDSYGWFTFGWGGYLAALILLAILYVRLLASGKYEISSKQRFCFFLSAVLVCLIKGNPLAAAAADRLFSIYVLELMILLFVVPPLWILSLPAEYLRSFFWSYRMRRMLQIMTHPWLTVFLFHVALSVYFIPAVFNVLHTYPVLAAAFEIFLLICSLLTWWTIISPLPEMTRLSESIRVLYVFIASILLMPIGIYLLVSGHPHYEMYASGQQLLPALSAVGDQQLGGGVLKAVQLTSYGIALFILISKWAKREEEPDDDFPYYPGETFDYPHKK